MLRSVRLTISLLMLGSSLLTPGPGALPSLNAANLTDADLARRFRQTVRPFVTSYCVVCHSGPTPAAGFDLQRYTTMESVVDDFAHWTLALRKLSAKEMPPQPMKQPPEDLRRQVIEWIAAVRKNEASKRAGDPGPVTARRLSNAEYNYTVRDLTGVDLRPAREFPVDPANQAGFDNSGEPLTISPSLMSKYLEAARRVADHLVLKPDGFAFAPHPMLVETDREKYPIRRIVDFYDRQPTDFADYFEADPAIPDVVKDYFDRTNAQIRWVERARLVAEPRQLDALLKFAARAYRRPIPLMILFSMRCGRSWRRAGTRCPRLSKPLLPARSF